MAAEPKTIQQARAIFSDPEKCRDYVVRHRWADGVVKCPACGSEKVTWQPKHNRWQCTNRHPRRQFTLKTRTVMEDSPLGLDKWMLAMWLVTSNCVGISSGELQRTLGITQKSAWFLLHRLRLAAQGDRSGRSLLSARHEEIMRRETEHKWQAAMNPNKRGPKPKAKKAAPRGPDGRMDRITEEMEEDRRLLSELTRGRGRKKP